MEHTEPYRTRDSSFAAYLLTLGYEPHTQEHDGVVWFHFELPDARDIKDKYFSGITISAIEYSNNMKRVKQLIFDSRQNNRRTV